MNLRSLALHLWLPSLKNRLRTQARRLRQPKYLIATSIGALYWWWYVGRRFFGLPPPRFDGRLHTLLEVALTLLGVVTVAFYWIFGSERGALKFSEAEVQFLFPALTRYQLIHYKLFRSIMTGLVGAALTMLVFGRRFGHPLWFTLGSWVAFTTLSLHATASSFTRASLAEHGLSQVHRRIGTVSAIIGFGGLLAWSIMRVELPPVEASLDWLVRAADSFDTWPASWALVPFRAPVHLALAPNAASFFEALPAALIVAGLHYVWVATSAVEFEEASLEAAERRARRRDAWSRGISTPRAGSRHHTPFDLPIGGRAETALAWKGLIGVMRRLSPWSLVALATGMGIALLSLGHTPSARIATSILAIIVLAVAALFGPALARFDLRHDMANLEVLRALPVKGRSILLGEIAAPAIVLALIEWSSILVAASTFMWRAEFSPGVRTALWLTVGFLAPALSMAGLMVQNAIVILLPGWVPVGPDRPRGPEALGLRLMVVVGNLFVMTFALLPSAIVGVVPVAILWRSIGWYSLPIGAAIAAMLIVLEVRLAASVLGGVFDRLEP
jgi:hypothetical protein